MRAEEYFKELEKKFGWKKEISEVASGVYAETEHPEPLKSYKIVYEAPNLSVEQVYKWILQFLRQDLGLARVVKVIDIFTPSESSSMWGNIQQRLGMQQDKVASYLATLGKLTNDLFAIVREIRVIKERLTLYKNSKKDHGADITLKGLYVDLVEGGSRNPASVYGMAREVGFTALPDLFFNATVQDKDKVEEWVEENYKSFNKAVRNVVKRKLYSYLLWREHTEKELKNRLSFTIKYLRQHWNSMKLYVEWIKPYLINIKRLMYKEEHLMSPDLISGFETNIGEIEFIATKPSGDKKKKKPVVLARFLMTTTPYMVFHNEYQRGGAHVGKIEIEIKAYSWSEEEIEAYKRYKDIEAYEIIGSIKEELKEAVDILKNDLGRFLDEEDEELKKIINDIEDYTGKKEEKEDKKKESKRENIDIFEPFKYLLLGFLDIIRIFVPQKRKEKSEKGSGSKGAEKEARLKAWLVYNIFKKANGMLSW